MHVCVTIPGAYRSNAKGFLTLQYVKLYMYLCSASVWCTVMTKYDEICWTWNGDQTFPLATTAPRLFHQTFRARIRVATTFKVLGLGVGLESGIVLDPGFKFNRILVSVGNYQGAIIEGARVAQHMNYIVLKFANSWYIKIEVLNVQSSFKTFE